MLWDKGKGDDKSTYHITATKGKNSRIIPMTEEVYDILKEMKRYRMAYENYTVDGKTDFDFRRNAIDKLLTRSVLESELRSFMDTFLQEYNYYDFKVPPFFCKLYNFMKRNKK